MAINHVDKSTRLIWKLTTKMDRARFEAYLRLKKIFLRALIVSLVTGTLIAVGVLLFGQFNQTTNRILGTLGVLALHSGIAMACTEALERRFWPALSRLGIILFSLNLVLFRHDHLVHEQR